MTLWLANKEMDTPSGYTSDGSFSMTDDLESYSPTEDSFFEQSDDLPVLIAVMGVAGSGKTTFVNKASGSCLKVGNDLKSCTSEIQETEEFILDGRRVVLVDTPGFDDSCKNDTEVLKSIAAFLGESYAAGSKLAGVIYVYKISDDRFGGLAAKNFRMFRGLCGENTLKNVILMTNMWGRVTPQQGAEREQQLKDDYFEAAIEKGAQLCRHDGTLESAQAILRMVLKNQPAVLKIQRELIKEHKDIERTGAGKELSKEICRAVVKYQKGIRELEEDAQRAIEDDDEETREELEEEKRRLQEEMTELRKALREMKSTFEEARREMEERINAKFEERLRQIREEYKAEIRRYEERVRELEQEGRENTSEITFLKVTIERLRGMANEARTRVNEAWKRSCIIM